MTRKQTWKTVVLGSTLALAACSQGCQLGDTDPPLTHPSYAEAALPAPSPLEFLQQCLDRYDREHINGYRLVMDKQERIDDKLQPEEVMDVAFRAEPYSVLMRWRQGARTAGGLLYIAGKNNDQMLVHPDGWEGKLLPVVAFDPDSAAVRRETRYSIKDFGLRNTLRRTLADWKQAQKEGTLHAEFVGIRKVDEVGDRTCYVLRQTQTPTVEGIAQVIVFIDRDTWFQVGTVLRGGKEELIGQYYYRDIQLNPSFDPDLFRESSLNR